MCGNIQTEKNKKHTWTLGKSLHLAHYIFKKGHSGCWDFTMSSVCFIKLWTFHPKQNPEVVQQLSQHGDKNVFWYRLYWVRGSLVVCIVVKAVNYSFDSNKRLLLLEDFCTVQLSWQLPQCVSVAPPAYFNGSSQHRAGARLISVSDQMQLVCRIKSST